VTRLEPTHGAYLTLRPARRSAVRRSL
jgi:hypothetical protein